MSGIDHYPRNAGDFQSWKRQGDSLPSRKEAFRRSAALPIPSLWDL